MKQVFCIFFLTFTLVNCNKKQETKSLTTLELKELLSKEKIQLVDVRTPKEVADGSIKTALFVNYFDADFYSKATQKLDKTKPVYLYCKSGGRSGKSAKILQEKGFEVVNILGGYSQWKTEN